ncbi:MAG: cytochrome c [Bdellovibrionota bacterium]
MLTQNFRIALWLTFSIVSAADVRADSRVEVSTINGQVLYGKLCAKCHGVNGRPDDTALKLLDPSPSDLTAKSYRFGDRREDLIRVIRYGSGRNMIHYQDRLSDEQAGALADYVLKLKAGSE